MIDRYPIYHCVLSGSVREQRSLSVAVGENQLLPCTLSTVKFSETATAKQVTFVPVKQKLPQQSVVHLPSYQVW